LTGPVKDNTEKERERNASPMTPVNQTKRR